MLRSMSCCAVIWAMASQLFAAEPSPQAATLSDALSGGKLLLNLRPRYEHVEQGGKPLNADAFTLRTLLGWRTKPWHGVSLTLEAINVAHLGAEKFNDDPSATSSYPTVADPQDTDVNQLYLEYTGLPKTSVRAGRQSLKLDNVRFIGNVEFRQVMQVFNALVVENRSLPNTRILAGYLWRQKTILASEREIDAPIVNVRYNFSPTEMLIGYGYLQDQANTGQNTGFADNSNRILGVRLDGAHDFDGKWKLLYTAEYARQNDYSGGDARIDADYHHVGLGAQYAGWFLRADHEQLGSNAGLYGFQTPLGTNHLFQGWADLFLTTPREGIRDTFLAGGGKLGQFSFYGEYHRYESDFGGIDFGDEIDLSVSYPFTKRLLGKIEYADYRQGDAVQGKVDTRKFWLTLIYQY